MLKKLVAGLFAMLVITCSGSLFAAEAAENTGTFKERLAKTAAAYENHAPMTFVFYLDDEGHASYEEKDLNEIIKSMQSKMPLYAKLKADSQFEADFDLFREEKYNQFMKEAQTTNPAFADAGNSGESGKKVNMSKEVIEEFLNTTAYDGMLIVRIDKVEEKATVNYTNAILFGIGGVNTKVEMDIVTRVFNKKSPQGYVFNNKQRVVGKVSGSWAPVTASRRAIPLAMKNIKEITVE